MTWLADLRVPAETASMRTVRLFVGGVAARTGLDVDAIEDLQAGTAECAGVLVEDLPAGAVLELSMRRDGDVVAVTGVIDTDRPEATFDELSRLVLLGTVDDHEIEAGPGRRSFSVHKRRG